jgi:hypothetical protein
MAIGAKYTVNLIKVNFKAMAYKNQKKNKQHCAELKKDIRNWRNIQQRKKSARALRLK